MRVYFDQKLESDRELLERAFDAYGLEVLSCFVSEEPIGERVFKAPVYFGQVLDYVCKKSLPDKVAESENLRFAGCSLDLAQGFFRRDGEGQETVRLTDKECEILTILYRAEGVVVERETLLRDVWGYASGVETHTVETHIYRLRQKIELDSAEPSLVITDGSGYRLKI